MHLATQMPQIESCELAEHKRERDHTPREQGLFCDMQGTSPLPCWTECIWVCGGRTCDCGVKSSQWCEGEGALASVEKLLSYIRDISEISHAGFRSSVCTYGLWLLNHASCAHAYTQVMANVKAIPQHAMICVVLLCGSAVSALTGPLCFAESRRWADDSAARYNAARASRVLIPSGGTC